MTIDTADLSKDLMASASPTSPKTAADAQRAMSSTDAWKPAFNRRQSWNKEEHKRELQMSKVSDVKETPGFTERAS